MKRWCDCADKNKPHKCPVYEQERNRLLRRAAEYANGVAGVKPPVDTASHDWRLHWDRLFLAKTDEMARDMGLVG